MPTDRYYIRRLQLGLGIFLVAAFTYFGRVDVNIVYGGDTWGYYGYLPSLFIYGDLKNPETTYLARFAYTNQAPYLPEKQGEFTPAANGHQAIKYTSGVAILQLPFFLLAHALAAIMPAVPADGYSWPYRWLVNLSVVVYFLLVIPALFSLLRLYVRPQLAAGVIIVLALGSNLFNFLIFRGVMAHAYLFSLYALLLWHTYCFYRSMETEAASSNKKMKWAAVWIGLTAGMITLIRPVEIICLAIPFFYGLSSWTAWKARPQLLLRNYRPLLLAVFCFILLGSVQLIYWKYVTDQWLFFSYGEERFFWDKSKIHAGLFDYRNGWLRYSPLLWLAILGWPLLLRKRAWWWPLTIFLPLHIYITYAWWNWYYINGFGSRPMVETYALLAIPMAILLQAVGKKAWLKWPVYAFVLACVLLNLFQHEQHVRGVLWPESGSKAHYWSVFGKLKTDYEAQIAFVSETLQPDTNSIRPSRQLYANPFEDSDRDSLLQTDVVASGARAIAVPPTVKYYTFFKGQLRNFLDFHTCDVHPRNSDGSSIGQWLEIRFKARKEAIDAPYYRASGIVVEGKWRNGWKVIRIDPMLGNTSHNIFFSGLPGVWEEIRYFYPLPGCLERNSELHVFLDNGSFTTYLDDISITLWAAK